MLEEFTEKDFEIISNLLPTVIFTASLVIFHEPSDTLQLYCPIRLGGEYVDAV